MNIGELLTNLTQAPRPKGVVNHAEQMRAFDALSDDLYEGLINALQDPEVRGEILVLARKRLEAGYVEYRDDMFHANDSYLGQMVFEELADAINWSLPIRYADCLGCDDPCW